MAVINNLSSSPPACSYHCASPSATRGTYRQLPAGHLFNLEVPPSHPTPPHAMDRCCRGERPGGLARVAALAGAEAAGAALAGVQAAGAGLAGAEPTGAKPAGAEVVEGVATSAKSRRQATGLLKILMTLWLQMTRRRLGRLCAAARGSARRWQQQTTHESHRHRHVWYQHLCWHQQTGGIIELMLVCACVWLSRSSVSGMP